jgi:amino acid adenylation domain-containing protein
MAESDDLARDAGGSRDVPRARLRDQILARLQQPPAPGEAAATRTLEISPPQVQGEPFPLLDLQQAYWIGREHGPHRTACHGYLELDITDLDRTRLEDALNKLIGRHPMLRAVIAPDGTQCVLSEVPRYRVPVADPGPAPDEAARRVREEMSHQVIPADTWPLFDIRVTRLPERVSRVHISFDILIADALSFQILATELADLYADPDRALPAIGVTFRDYVLRISRDRQQAELPPSAEQARAGLLDLPPAPDLPAAREPASTAPARFTRLEKRIDGEQWQSLRGLAREMGVGTAAAVLAAFADTIAMWAASPDFTLNLTAFDRAPVHPDINRVVGPFTSSMLLGVHAGAHESVRAFAVALQRDLWRNLDDRSLSGVAALRELSRLRGGDVSMPIVFTHVQTPDHGDFREGLGRLGAVRFAISQTPQVSLDCQVLEAAGSLVLLWDVRTGTFDPAVLAEMFAAFGDAVGYLADPAAWAERGIAATPPSALGARTATEVSRRLPLRPLHELVAAGSGPRAAAVVDTGAGTTLTRADLLACAHGVARDLVSLGVQPGELVAVHVGGGWPMIAGVIGVCASGAAYLPLDTTLPAPRLAAMAQAGAASILVIGPGEERPGWFTGRTVQVRPPAAVADSAVADSAGEDSAGEDSGGLPAVPLGDLAYVIFTSGSTGEPKGVRITHGAAANTLLDINARYETGPGDRVLAVSSIGFDLSVWDVFGVLAAGGTVITPGHGAAAKDPDRWLAWLTAHRVTVWNSVPALMGLLVELAEQRAITLPDLRLVLLSGDWIPLSLPGRISRVAPNARVVSLGGATEAAIWSVAQDIGAAPEPGWPSVPYGVPLTNQSTIVLDELGRERPLDVVGELVIGGDGVADGYWRAPKLTAQAFPPGPGGSRRYRTGDLVRRHRDGRLEILGRTDSQVKIQGYRVELGEIDAAVARLPEVRLAVTEATGPRDGQRQLVSYAVPARDDVRGDDLRAALSRTLPGYLVPARVILVPRLPLTANGKVDRSRLREITSEPADGAATPARPDGLVTAALDGGTPSPLAEFLVEWARNWRDDAGIDAQTNLVLSGMDSIDLVRMLNEFERDLDFRPPITDLVAAPTIATVQRLFEEDLVQRLRDGGRPAGGQDGLAPGPAADVALGNSAARRHALRGLAVTALAGRPGDDQALFDAERTERAFAPEPLSAAQLGGLLAPLRSAGRDRRHKYRYPSAGDIYAVSLLLHLTGVAGDLDPGVYYHNPLEHGLSVLERSADLDPDRYGMQSNRMIAKQAGFAIYLVADLDAIEPHYGASSLRYAAIEAGAMCMLLREAAPGQGVGLTQVGTFDDRVITAVLGLGARQPVIASLLGGPLAAGEDYDEGTL